MKTSWITTLVLSVAAAFTAGSTASAQYGDCGPGFIEQGILQGQSQLTQAAGAYNLNTSNAAINQQEVITRALENRQLAIQNYFAARQMNAESRAAERGSRFSTAEYAELARKMAPDRLTARQYQSSLGTLHWPAALMDDEFAAERFALGAAFATRGPNDAGVGSEFHREVKDLTDRLDQKLRQEVHTMSPMEFVAAKKFVAGLQIEAHHVPAPAGLAMSR